MKVTRPCYFLLASLVFLALCPAGYAAVSMVDTFNQGGFSISRPCNPNPISEAVNLPLAQQRGAAFRVLSTPPDTAMTSTLNSASGSLTFIVTGTTQFPTAPPSLQLVYSGGGPYNITGCTEFILGFSQLSGVGSLYIEAGSSDGSTGEHRVDLTGPGDIYYSVINVKPNSIHSVDSFNILRFVFESRSPEFSFTLDEIRLVPEPSGALLTLAVGAGFLALRRRRGWGT